MDKKSPITEPPLRQAGQSIEEERQRIFDDEVLVFFIASMVVVLFAVFEWWRWFRETPPQPWLMSAIAGVVLGYSTYRILRAIKKLKNLRQARDGEKAVGEYLERLRGQGYTVFHDVIGVGFNLDHIIIGPAGIFTIETKTWSKPAKGSPIIKCDGECLSMAGYEPDRNPIIQAKAQASWLKALLEQSTGKSYTVRPVVVFPGWFIEQPKEAMREVWVLEPKALPKFLENAAQKLDVEHIKMAEFHLSRYVRESEKQKSRPH